MLPSADQPTRPLLTHLVFLADASAPMSALAAEFRAGFNTYITTLAPLFLEAHLWVTVYNSTPDFLEAGRLPEFVLPLDGVRYRPQGRRALFDAVSETIAAVDRRIGDVAATERVLVTVFAGGGDRGSVRSSAQTVRDLVAAREATGRWEFLHLGPDAGEAARMGFLPGNTVTVPLSSAGMYSMFDGLTTAASAFTGGASGPRIAAILSAAVADRT